MSFTPRAYQQDAIDANITFFKSNSKKHAIEILPTGSGKSVVIANTAMQLEGKTVVFQPTKEILEQNYSKFISYGYRAGIYSASAGMKYVDKITFATIGSVAKKHHLFRDFQNIIIDECHMVSAKGGMYLDFINSVDQCKVLGLTATPYRLTSGFDGAMLKFLTRTRPRVFSDVLYYIQNNVLFDNGFLAKLEYFAFSIIDRSMLSLNSTGTDYTDASLKAYYRKINMPQTTAYYANRLLAKRKSLLIFCALIEEAEKVRHLVDGSVILTGKTDSATREKILSQFKSGKIKCVVNVGVLTTGFDYPELECVLLARSTMSLALYYQMCLDMETEILTKRGFLKHNDLTIEDKVAAYDKNSGEITWEDVQNITYRNMYEGEYFVKATGPHLDFKVTNKHDMIIKCRGAVNYLKEEAENIFNRNPMLYLPVSGIEKSSGADLSDDEIMFIGLFLSDGNLNKTTNAITIVQSLSHPELIHEIERIINACGFKYGKTLRNRKGVEAKYNDMYHFTISYGTPRLRGKEKKGWKCIEKFIDKSLNENYELLNDRQFGILLSGINLGDGRKSFTDYKRSTYTLAMGDNKNYADKVQSLAVRRGYRCNRYIQTKAGFKDQYLLYVKKVTHTTIAGNNVFNNTIKVKPIERTRPQKESGSLDKKVWCIQNKIGSIITRRNGKVLITGNCGRAMRPHPDKASAWIVDLGNNINYFGKVETMKIKVDERGLHSVYNNGRQLTNVTFTK